MRGLVLLYAALFVLGDCGYFQPYGGRSPGPRFIGAALPFLGRWR